MKRLNSKVNVSIVFCRCGQQAKCDTAGWYCDNPNHDADEHKIRRVAALEKHKEELKNNS